jgi:hypothetical protein
MILLVKNEKKTIYNRSFIPINKIPWKIWDKEKEQENSSTENKRYMEIEKVDTIPITIWAAGVLYGLT